MSSNLHKDYFFDMPIDLCCVIQPSDHKILLANPAFEYILGWKPEEITGQMIDAFVNSEMDKTNLVKAFSKVNSGIHSFTFETQVRTKNNMIRSIDWKCYLTDEHEIYAIGRDVTAHKEAEKGLAQQSHLDQLTGVADRQTFLALLQNELSGAIRYHFPTAVIMVDIDHFKNYNEKHGMQKGDECLKSVANALKTFLRRKTDFLARFENDSFVILLSHTNLEKAIKSAEYLRDSLEKLAMSHNGDPSHQPITISLGVTALPENMEKEVSTEFMISSARRALSVSQQRGGNQVSCSEDFGGRG